MLSQFEQSEGPEDGAQCSILPSASTLGQLYLSCGFAIKSLYFVNEERVNDAPTSHCKRVILHCTSLGRTNETVLFHAAL